MCGPRRVISCRSIERSIQLVGAGILSNSCPGLNATNNLEHNVHQWVLARENLTQEERRIILGRKGEDGTKFTKFRIEDMYINLFFE